VGDERLDGSKYGVIVVIVIVLIARKRR